MVWLTTHKGRAGTLEGVSRFQLLSDAQWELMAPMLPTRTGRQGRPFSDARTRVEAIIYRHGAGFPGGICPGTSCLGRKVWARCRRMAAEGTWDMVLVKHPAAADSQALEDWSV